MIISKSDIVAKIRTAIDDVTPSASDSFTTNTDNELWQAAQHAVQSLLEELPIDMLLQKSQNMVQSKDSANHPLYIGLVSGAEVLVYRDGSDWKHSHDYETNPDVAVTIDSGTIPTPQYTSVNPLASGFADGSGIIPLADDYLRFVSLKLSTWNGPVYELIEAGSDEEKRQRSSWSRGTATKPRVLLEYDTTNNVFRLRYFTAGKTSGTYNHTIESLYYIPKAVIMSDIIYTPLKDDTERMVIYRAASIFFEGKKETNLAEQFKNI